MELSDQLLCLFNAEIERTGDDFTVSVPRREIDAGSIEPGAVYRIAVIGQTDSDAGTEPPRPAPNASPTQQPQPPVEVGEIRYVEIEDLGKQGDGIARVERGYVIIVPGTDVDDRVKVEISEVKSNFAVGEVIEETFE